MPRQTMLHQTSSSTTVGSQDRVSSNAPRSRPGTSGYGKYPDGPEDPRRNCSSQLNKHYTWEMPTPGDTPSRMQTASTQPQDDNVSILSAVTNKQGNISMGKRKKEDCLKGTGAEILVGFDTTARPGLRVVVSSRSSFVSKPGRPCCGTVTKPCCGTVTKVINGGAECVVLWDDESGPFRYASCQNLGYHLTIASEEHERELAVEKEHGLRVHLVHAQAHAPSRDSAARLAEALKGRGCHVQLPEEGAYDARATTASSAGGFSRIGSAGSVATPQDLHAALRKATLCVLLLDDAASASLLGRHASSSLVYKELEFALQALSDPKSALAIVHVPPAPLPPSGLGPLAVPLAAVPMISLPSLRAIDQVAEQLATLAVRNAPVPRSRGSSRA